MQNCKIKKHYKQRFTQIDNSFINDMQLSFQAKGVFLYLWSKPDDWQVSVKAMQYECVDKQTKIYSALKELELHGYLVRKRYYINGKVAGINYNLSDVKDFLFDQGELNQENLNEESLNEYIYTKKDITKKDITKERSAANKSTSTLQTLPSQKTASPSKVDQELKTKPDVERFVRNFKANVINVDGREEICPIFSQKEVDLITEYILLRKESYKSKVKSTHKALTGVLNDILEVRCKIPLEEIFKRLDGVYVNCGTAGDKTKPYQSIKLSHFTTLLKTKTNYNHNDNTLRRNLSNYKTEIRNINPDQYF